jgi:ribosomal protein S12 methylthiotransferase
MKLHLVSLGCAKNLVDSEVMMGGLKQIGWTNTSDPGKADTIIINTCSFIESAIDESIDTILKLASFKHTGVCKRLIVTGCLPERFREEIIDALPEVDFFLGTGAFDEIAKAVVGASNKSICHLPDPDAISLQKRDTPRVLSSPAMAYLKIAEGCNRYCTYCIIPKLRGKQKSRQLNDIVGEARSLVKSGVKELILIAQDTTNYGKDLNPRSSLTRVLEEISDISDKVWIRVLYGHPESIDDSFIRTVADRRNICSYFDIPIQHVSDKVLRKMGRNYSSDSLCKLFDTIRTKIADAALRTTAIVGFPGETDEDFEELLTFVNDICFDNLGVFIYSDSEDLPSHKLPCHISENVAKYRYDRLMSCQSDISLKNNQMRIGKVYDVFVEKAEEENLFRGRTYFQAPEVDTATYIRANKLNIGSFIKVSIADASEYDLAGEVV